MILAVPGSNTSAKKGCVEDGALSCPFFNALISFSCRQTFTIRLPRLGSMTTAQSFQVFALCVPHIDKFPHLKRATTLAGLHHSNQRAFANRSRLVEVESDMMISVNVLGDDIMVRFCEALSLCPCVRAVHYARCFWARRRVRGGWENILLPPRSRDRPSATKSCFASRDVRDTTAPCSPCSPTERHVARSRRPYQQPGSDAALA